MPASCQKPADYQQRTEALNLGHSVLVSAPAGSGKTEILTQRYLRTLMTVERPERILAITFTLKSAAEMKNRVMAAIQKATGPEPAEGTYEQATWKLANQVLQHSNQHKWNILDNPNRLRIQTIDSLHAYLMAQLPLLSGFGGTPRIEEDANRLYTNAALNLLRELDDKETHPEDIKAIGHLLELAGNRTERLIPRLCNLLACRDQWLDALNEVDPMHMEQALQGFVRATLQLASEKLSTFNSEQLINSIFEASGNSDTLDWAAGLDKIPRASIGKLKIWRKLATFLTTQNGSLKKRVTIKDGFPPKTDCTISLNAWLKSVQESGEGFELGTLLNRVSHLPEVTYPARAQEFREHLVRSLTRLVGHLQLIFSQENTMDFVEVSRRALSALIDNGSVSDVLMKLDYQIQHILVDEQQDTALPQIRLLETLTEGWSEGDGRTLFLVGDAQQSIYQFRQADVRLFNRLWESKRLGNIPLHTIKLTENFRSDPALVEWVNETMEAIAPKTVDHYDGSIAFSPSVPFKTDKNGHVSVHPLVGGDDNDEAEEVVGIIRSTQAEYPKNKIVVLVRARTHLQSIIHALQANKIPYSATKIDPLANRPQVKDALALIKALWHPMDRLSWVGLLRSAFVGMTWQDILSVCEAAGQSSMLSGLYAVLNSSLLTEDGICRARRLVSAIRNHSISGELSGEGNFPDLVRTAWYSLGGAMIVT
ncbi:UvrD-helicase domain-containing protein, partial [Acidihalobacter prosperus]